MQLMEVEIHPGDEYLSSLEPQSLQVLVRFHDQSILNLCLHQCLRIPVYKLSVHAVHDSRCLVPKLLLYYLVCHIQPPQTYIKFANVPNCSIVTPSGWRSVWGKWFNILSGYKTRSLSKHISIL